MINYYCETFMTKAFTVTFTSERPSNNFGFYSQTISVSSGYGNNCTDDRPILVVANNIKEVALAYPNAESIVELLIKEVKILDSVRITCPVISS